MGVLVFACVYMAATRTYQNKSESQKVRKSMESNKSFTTLICGRRGGMATQHHTLPTSEDAGFTTHNARRRGLKSRCVL